MPTSWFDENTKPSSGSWFEDNLDDTAITSPPAIPTPKVNVRPVSIWERIATSLAPPVQGQGDYGLPGMGVSGRGLEQEGERLTRELKGVGEGLHEVITPYRGPGRKSSRMGGASKAFRSALGAVGPYAGLTAATASPLAAMGMAYALPVGLATNFAMEEGAKALGADEDTAAFVSDVAGVLTPVPGLRKLLKVHTDAAEMKAMDEWLQKLRLDEELVPPPPAPIGPSIELLFRRKQQQELASRLGLAYPKPKPTGLERAIEVEIGTEAQSLLPLGVTRATRPGANKFLPPGEQGATFAKADLRPPVVGGTPSPYENFLLPRRMQAPEVTSDVPARAPIPSDLFPVNMRGVEPSTPTRPVPGQPLTERQQAAFEAFTSGRPTVPRDEAELNSPDIQAKALRLAESINRPTTIKATKGPLYRTPKSAKSSANVFARIAAQGDSPTTLSAFGVGALDDAANRIWESAKRRFSPAVETEIKGGKLSPLQQAAADRAAEVEAARANKATLYTVGLPANASAWKRGMHKLDRLLNVAGTRIDDKLRMGGVYHRMSVNAGERYKGTDIFDSLADRAINAYPIAIEKLKQLGFDMVENLSRRSGQEASEFIQAPHFKTLEIRNAGKRVYESALKDKTNPLHKEVSKLESAYNAAKEAYGPVREGKVDADEALSLSDALHESKAALDQWMINHGESFWDTLRASGERGPRTGRTVAEIEGVMNDPEFIEKYTPYKEMTRRVFDSLEQDAVDSGIVSQELMTKMREMYPDYVRISRVVDDGLYGVRTGVGRSRAVGHLPSTSEFQKFEGGNQPIEDVFTSLFDKAMTVTSEANRNRVGLQLADYATRPNEDGTVGRAIWRDILRVVPEKEVKSGKFTPNEANSIAYLQNGRKRYLEIKDPLLTMGLRNIKAEQVNPWLVASARMLRLGATGINPEFFVKNLPRDTEQLLHTAPYVRESILAIPQAFKQTVLGEGTGRSAMTMFGSGFNENIMYRSPASRSESMSHVFSRPRIAASEGAEFLKGVATDPKALLKIPGAGVRTGAEFIRLMESGMVKSEEFSRLRTFISVRNQIMKPGGANAKFGGGKLGGKSIAERYGLDEADVAKGLSADNASAIAAQEANNALPPYHRSGAWMAKIAPVVPYLNAGQKAVSSTLRRAYDNPAKFIATWSIVAGVPTVAATAWNLQDERMAKLNFELSEVDKSTSLIRLLPTPFDGESYQEYKDRVTDQKSGKYKTINIPLAQGIIGEGQILLRRAIEDAYRRNPQSVVDKINTFLTPPTPNPTDQEEGLSKPSIRPLTGRDVLNRVGASVLPFEPSVGGAASSLLPPAARIPIENWINRDLRTGLPIVSDSMSRLSGVPEMQSNPERPSSPTLTKAAAWMAQSGIFPATTAPQHLENIVVKQLGTGGRHAINLLDAAMGVPQDERGGRNPFTGISDIFRSTVGGEQRRIESDFRDEETVKDRRDFYLSIPKPQFNFLTRSGYTPSLPKRKVETTTEDIGTGDSKRTMVRTLYKEPDDVYSARVKARGTLIAALADQLEKTLDLEKWKKADRTLKQKELAAEVGIIDDQLNSLYTDDSITDEQRIQVFNAIVSKYSQLAQSSAIQ